MDDEFQVDKISLYEVILKGNYKAWKQVKHVLKTRKEGEIFEKIDKLLSKVEFPDGYDVYRMDMNRVLTQFLHMSNDDLSTGIRGFYVEVPLL
jgi:hypothetical protein